VLIEVLLDKLALVRPAALIVAERARSANERDSVESRFLDGEQCAKRCLFEPKFDQRRRLGSRPLIRVPATNSPANSTPNQIPNCLASLTARQTRSRGALRRTRFSM
jgi:hypothetical protein